MTAPRLPLFCLLLVSALARAETAYVAAAPELAEPMAVIAEHFRRETGHALKLTYGAPGRLAERVATGDTFELFVTISHGDDGVPGIEPSARKTLASGIIGLYIPAHSHLHDLESLDETLNALIYGDYRKIALPDPRYDPYGAAAMEALQSGGLWTMRSDRSIRVESAAQVTPFAASWNVDAAVIPAALLHDPALAGEGRYFPVPETWHAPLGLHAILAAGAGVAAREFYEFLGTEEVKRVLEERGYRK